MKEEIIVHQYQLRLGGDYYKVLVTGSKYQAEQYMKNEFKADEVIWQKSFVTTRDIAINLGKKNKTITRQGMFLRLEFSHQLGTKRNKSLNEKKRSYADIIKIINQKPDSKFSIKELRECQKISTKEIAYELCITQQTYRAIESKHIIPNDIPDIKDMISSYLGVSRDNIDWAGEFNV